MYLCIKLKRMTAIELKKQLIHKIAGINDISFLEALKTLVDSKSAEKIITLSAEQEQEIEESIKDLEMGLFVSQVALDKKIELWASGK